MTVPTNRSHRLTDAERESLRRINRFAPVARRRLDVPTFAIYVVVWAAGYFALHAILAHLWLALLFFGALLLVALSVLRRRRSFRTRNSTWR